MVAGHLQEKKGYYYAVLSYKDADKRRRTKWIASGLPVKGNKKKAEGFLQEQRRSFEIPLADQPIAEDGQELFADYLQRWLQVAKTTVAPTTYGSYGGLLRNPIDPWFRKKRITLQGLTASDLQAFYMEQGRRVKPNTVIHYHAVIHRALKYAVKMDLISVNPADKVDRPRKNGYQANFYSESEIAALFAAISDTLIEVPVKLAAFYGLRRSEVMGLRWDAVDFVHNTICIRHTVTGCTIDGQYQIIAADTTKTRSSRRTLPLVPTVREMLLRLKEQQEQNRKICGQSYSREFADYICVNKLGGNGFAQHIFPVVSAKRWNKTTCGISAFTTCATAAQRCCWRMVCRSNRFRSGWGTAISARQPTSTRTLMRRPNRSLPKRWKNF